jgi:hypothetical protein
MVRGTRYVANRVEQVVPPEQLLFYVQQEGVPIFGVRALDPRT